MNYRIYLLSVFLICMSIIAMSQNLQKFSGAYRLSEPWLQDAKADYSFKENNSVKIFEGKFTLSFIGKDSNKGLTQTVTGKFKNGLRDGKWVFLSNMKDWQFENNNYKTGTCTLTVNYKEGNPEGIWTCNFSYKTRQKSEQKGKTVFSAFSKPFKETIKIEFKDAVVKSFTADVLNEKSEAVKMSGMFDEQGFYHSGEPANTSKPVDEIWFHGLKNPDEEQKTNLNVYLNYLSKHPDSLAYLQFTYKTIGFRERNSNEDANLKVFLSKVYQPLFFWSDIPGDLGYDTSKINNDNLQKLLIKGFYTREYCLQNAKEKVLPAEQAEMFKKINGLLKTIQSEITEPKIDKCSKIDGAAEKFGLVLKYRDTLAQVQGKITNLEKYYKGVSSFKNFQEIISEKDLFKEIKETEILNYTYTFLASAEKKISPLVKELEILLNDNEYNALLNEGNNFLNQKNYPAALKAFETAKILKPEEQEPKTKIEEVNRRESLKGAEDLRMKNISYLSEHFRKIPVNYKSGEIKKHLYNAYQVLKEYMVSEMDNSKYDAYQKLEISKQLIKLVDKMNELQNQDTEELEKQLKKAKEPEAIKALFGI